MSGQHCAGDAGVVTQPSLEQHPDPAQIPITSPAIVTRSRFEFTSELC